jgi:hypothetical protein
MCPLALVPLVFLAALAAPTGRSTPRAAFPT